MTKQPTPQKPRREGTAVWVSDHDGALLREVATAEERTIQVVLARALKAYARGSREYQESVKGRRSE